MKSTLKHDRRHIKTAPAFPFFDSDNNLVTKDRRKTTSDHYTANDPETRLHQGPIDQINAQQAAGTPDVIRQKAERIVLTHDNKTFVIDSKHCPQVIGRVPGVDILLNNNFISRKHAVIDFVDDVPVVIDQSRNGTFIYVENQPRVHIINDHYFLHTNGTLSFGTPKLEQRGQIIQFTCEEMWI